MYGTALYTFIKINIFLIECRYVTIHVLLTFTHRKGGTMGGFHLSG